MLIKCDPKPVTSFSIIIDNNQIASSIRNWCMEISAKEYSKSFKCPA